MAERGQASHVRAGHTGAAGGFHDQAEGGDLAETMHADLGRLPAPYRARTQTQNG